MLKPSMGWPTPEEIRFWPLYVGVFCFALVCLLSSEVLQSRAEYWPILGLSTTYRELLKELGFACIISIIISITLEATAKKAHRTDIQRHITEVNRNVFGGIFGIFLPQNIIKEFVDIIVDSKFVKTSYVIKMDIDLIEMEIDNKKETLSRLRLTLSYDIENTTPNIETYGIQLQVQDPPRYAGWPRDMIDNVFVDGINVSSPPVNGAALTPTALDYIHQKELSANQKASVIVQSVFYRGASDSELIFGTTACSDLRLEIRRSSKLARVGAAAIHRSPLALVSESSDGTESIWRMKSPVLPSQGVYVWWRDK